MKIPLSFINFQDTLSECSKSKDGKKVVVNSSKMVVNFDKFKEHYNRNILKKDPGSPGPDGCPCSVDTIFEDDNGDIVFVEFKSGDAKTKQIVQKIYDSVLIYSEIEMKTTAWFRDHAVFILVYPDGQFGSEDKNDSARQNLMIKGSRNSNVKMRFVTPKHIQGFFFKETTELSSSDFVCRYVPL